MFEHLAKHKKIIVTGPNRSGTTLAATAIQHDLKTTHGLIKEELCQFRIEGVQVWMDCPEPMVIQAPFIADACHQFPTALVVYMHRDLKDIEK